MALLAVSRAADPFGAPNYLEWNLFLAWIPLVLGYLLWSCARMRCPRIVLVLAAAIWLVFLPNAPYLLTDLVHAGTANGGTSTLDVLTLATFAATGLVLFFASVTAASEGVRLAAGNRLARAVIPVSAVLASVGMYLGRVLRWNSWDLLVRPFGSPRGNAALPAQPGRSPPRRDVRPRGRGHPAGVRRGSRARRTPAPDLRRARRRVAGVAAYPARHGRKPLISAAVGKMPPNLQARSST